MGTFNGSAKALFEETGRLSLPKVFYKSIDEDERDILYLAVDGRKRCILAYPKSQWEGRMKKLTDLDHEDNEEVLRKMRLLQRSMKTVKIDKQGRFYLPPEMKEHVSLGREVELLGLSTYFEIWSPNNLDQYEQSDS